MRLDASAIVAIDFLDAIESNFVDSACRTNGNANINILVLIKLKPISYTNFIKMLLYITDIMKRYIFNILETINLSIFKEKNLTMELYIFVYM